MISKIDFTNFGLLKQLYELQRTSYLIEAKLIGFFEIPPLIESMADLQQCDETFLGYFNDEELAGAISYTVEGNELTICRMVVHPNHFRKGIAQNLLKYMEENNRQLVVCKVSTGKENIPAKNLYLKNGFQFVQDHEVAPGLFISNFEKQIRT